MTWISHPMLFDCIQSCMLCALTMNTSLYVQPHPSFFSSLPSPLISSWNLAVSILGLDGSGYSGVVNCCLYSLPLPSQCKPHQWHIQYFLGKWCDDLHHCCDRCQYEGLVSPSSHLTPPPVIRWCLFKHNGCQSISLSSFVQLRRGLELHLLSQQLMFWIMIGIRSDHLPLTLPSPHN